MGLTKTDLFTDNQNQLAELAKALGHPARIAILEHLIQHSKCVNSGLVKELGLAQATISQHLKELKRIGIIQGTIEGVSMCYCINNERWIEIKALFNALFVDIQTCNSQCC